MKRDYFFPSSGPNMDFMREFLEEALGESGKLLHFETVDAPDWPGWFEHRFTIDWFGVNEWLDAKVRRLISDLDATENWRVTRVNFFVDFAFPPLVSPAVEERAKQFPKLAYEWCTRMLYEHCEIHGPERYGAIGEYWDTYRFYAAPIDMDVDANRLFDVEDSLEVCVERIARYIRSGEGKAVNIGKRYFNKEA